MSSAGINPLAILAPDLYAKQLAIQRRQALAQSLLQSGGDNPGGAAYGGLRNAGNAILGAFLAKGADQDNAALYSGSGQDTPQPSPQLSNTPQAIPSQSQPMANDGPPPQVANTPGAGIPAPQQALGQALQGKRTPASVMGGAIPDLPGLTHQQSMLAYFQNPAEYWKALASANAPTDTQKNANFAYPGDTEGQRGMVAAGLTKAGTIPITRGMALVPDGRGGMAPIYAPPQAPEGYQNQMGPNGLQMAPVPGGPQAVAASAMAKGAGSASVTPFTGYDQQGMPQATNALAMSGNPTAQGLMGQMPPSGAPNIDRNNPWNVSPGGTVTPHSTPTAGMGQAWDNLGLYAKRGINTVAGIMNTWAPERNAQGRVINPDTPQNIARISQQLGVQPNQPIPLENSEVRGRVLDLMRPTETGNRYGPSSGQGGGLLPALPTSQGPYMAAQGKDAADRHDATVAAAAESSMRINVLDNIIKLSQSGVNTGPGAEFQNAVGGYIANTPGLGKLFKGTQANVGNFQELQKFMYQNALRNWQAAGGTGTDSQLESAAKANPNDHLFPQALQTIAKWGKASELAVKGKANAQDAFLQQNGQTPANQLKFENTWRNSFDPKVFQYSLMTQPEKQAFAQQELKTPQAAKAFLAKQQQLKALGAIQ